jgi:hypothetical protein
LLVVAFYRSKYKKKIQTLTKIPMIQNCNNTSCSVLPHVIKRLEFSVPSLIVGIDCSCMAKEQGGCVSAEAEKAWALLVIWTTLTTYMLATRGDDSCGDMCNRAFAALVL